MTLSKIQLSDAELQLIGNADLILTKNKAMEKIKGLLEEAQRHMQEFVVQHSLHAHEIFRTPPKISKGEQYLGLPWIILDYPRVFNTDSIFAIRSMFWWGNFFSSTLHLSGSFATRSSFTGSYLHLQEHYINTGSDPWQHHFEKDNYTAVAGFPEEEWTVLMQGKDPVKIAIKWPVTEWHSVPERMFGNWKKILALLNYPGGETGLSPDNPRAWTGL